MTADMVPRISLRDFDNRREAIKAEIMDAATNSGFLYVIPSTNQQLRSLAKNTSIAADSLSPPPTCLTSTAF